MRIKSSDALRTYQQSLNIKKVSEDSKEKFKGKDVSQVQTETADDRAIKQKILKMQQWENHVKSHEAAHASAGGSHVSTASYIYGYGPDGKKYIVGGSVSVTIPRGLSQESLETLRHLKNATSASYDQSPQDMISSAIISAEEKSRMQIKQLKEATERYEKQKQQESAVKFDEGKEIFSYKKFNLSSTRLLELFV